MMMMMMMMMMLLLSFATENRQTSLFRAQFFSCAISNLNSYDYLLVFVGIFVMKFLFYFYLF